MLKLIFAFTCLFLAVPCQARIITVDDNGPADFSNIQAAINDSNDGDTIIVSDGTYIGDGNRDINFGGRAITVRSVNGPHNCIIDCGQYNQRGFIFNHGEDANSVISGLTITGGRAFPKGGGIYCNTSSPTIENCIIINNCAMDLYDGQSYGGGIYCGTNSNPTIIECIIKGNEVLGGSGFDFGMDGESGYGGGIYCSADSHATIENCVVVDNEAIGGNGFIMMDPVWGGNGYGGGIYGNVTINNTVIIHNTALGGDGVYGGDGYGGGIYTSSSTINNGTISANTAAGGQDYPVGEGFSDGGGMYSDGSTTLTNCILWGNSPYQIYGIALVGYSDVQGGWLGPGNGNINANPYFADSTNGDYHLKSQAGRWNPNSESWVQDDVTSPCIDAGDPNSDWTAELWPHGKRINMGAYGGTPQASMSPLINLGYIADLNNDDKVDFGDLMLFTNQWQNEQLLLSEDLDRNGFVDFTDFAIFGQQWSYPSASEPGIFYQVEDCNMEAGQGQPMAADSNDTRFSVWVEGSYIHFEDLITANCCLDEIELQMTVEDNLITIYEIEHLIGIPCPCICDYPVTAMLGPFDDGNYLVEVIGINGSSLGFVEVTIGETTEPGIVYQIEDCNQEASGVFTAELPDPTRFTVTVEGLYIHFEDLMYANCCPDELELEMTVEDNLITIFEIEYTSEGCRCMCSFPITATLGPFEPGIYTLEVYETTGGFIGSTTITIGQGE